MLCLVVEMRVEVVCVLVFGLFDFGLECVWLGEWCVGGDLYNFVSLIKLVYNLVFFGWLNGKFLRINGLMVYCCFCCYVL